jgi:hypothetical protein
MKYVLLALVALSMTACSGFGKVEEPLQATGGTLVQADVIKVADVAPAPIIEEAKIPKLVAPTVPRIKQAQIVGVLRELRSNGCLFKKVATTDGIHYSQLVITCGDAQMPPNLQ